MSNVRLLSSWWTFLAAHPANGLLSLRIGGRALGSPVSSETQAVVSLSTAHLSRCGSSKRNAIWYEPSCSSQPPAYAPSDNTMSTRQRIDAKRRFDMFLPLTCGV